MHTTFLSFLIGVYGLFSQITSGQADTILHASQNKCKQIEVQKINATYADHQKFPIYVETSLCKRTEVLTQTLTQKANLLPNQDNMMAIDCNHASAWYQLKDANKNAFIGNAVYGRKNCNIAQTPLPSKPAKHVWAFYSGKDSLDFAKRFANKNTLTGWRKTAQAFGTKTAAATFYAALRNAPDSVLVLVLADRTNTLSNDTIEHILVEERGVRRLLFIDLDNNEEATQLLSGESPIACNLDALNDRQLMYIHTKNPDQTALGILESIKGSDWNAISEALKQTDRQLVYRIGFFD
jgi:hypothetical protein